ncbi:MAG: hypothetical protein UW50_C0002G0012 [Candidatus Wolfebacteria bacterium GW2011_GWA1_44_24]|uniref:DUF8128 domain-containing protein n=1 Tax=Candidatus Wolfebacteria bacterium GW2011_GWB1_41_12 TaxID=1619006 RepID=A0A0G0UN82_9BACT|nr:MAG: hypothetical protein UU38_C0003G0223 [Candidatus Wolfebacteria bacterium GW2011_GWB1_41_12]KKT56335.1 MAG: hypothetical protein UW50_C0002G0012 [Candidatus Wolfebacteria bacterium GW2011_GWA1_44_24]
MTNAFDVISGVIGSILMVFYGVWWLVLPIILFLIFRNVWLIYVRTEFIRSKKWKLFEIKVPREILKTPKAMEQVFASLYASYTYNLSWLRKWIDGQVNLWFSFEIVGYHGGVYFYVYAPEERKNLIESAIYAQYPDAEIAEVEDYIDLLPTVLPNETFDLWGTELVLARENYLPIKTYLSFESMVEEQRLDPISVVAETMSKLKEGEFIWLQTLISPTGAPTGNNWKKEGEEKIAEIVGRGKVKKGGSAVNAWLKNFFWAPVEHPTWPGEKKPEAPAMKFLSPDEQDMVKEIANKISKLGYKTVIRFVYIDRRDSFTPANFSAMIGAFHQFNTQNLNAFKPNYMITLYDSLWARIFPKYKDLKTLYKKRRIFDYYKKRKFGKYNKVWEQKFPVLNIEELATIYHFPGVPVGAPRLRKLEFKKSGPPAGLPIE